MDVLLGIILVACPMAAEGFVDSDLSLDPLEGYDQAVMHLFWSDLKKYRAV